MKDLHLGEEQLKVIEAILSGESLIAVLGGPGTGKSTLIRALPSIAEQLNRKLVITATTGISATVISTKEVDATTINSAFSIGYGDTIPEGTPPLEEFKHKKEITTLPGNVVKKTISLLGGKKKKYDGLIVVIDEVSMLSSVTLLMVIQVLDKYLSNKYNLIVSGDPKQMPPVLSRPGDGKFWENPRIADSKGRIVREWENIWKKFKVFKLTKIYRTNHKEYIENLRLLSYGICSSYFTNKIVKSNSELNPEALNIYASNSEMIEHNKRVLSKFRDIKVFTAVFHNSTQMSRYPIPDEVLLESIFPIQVTTELAIGARFMVRQNIRENDKLVLTNGTIGTIIDFCGKDGIVLEVNGRAIKVFPREIELPKDQKGRPYGYFYGLPGHLAYAITGHKCQGLSLPKGTPIVIHPYIFQKDTKVPKPISWPGWLYVTLSRNSDPDDIQIANDFNDENIMKKLMCASAVADNDAIKIYESTVKPVTVGGYKVLIEYIGSNQVGCYTYKGFEITYDAMGDDHKDIYVLRYKNGDYIDSRLMKENEFIPTEDVIVQFCREVDNA